MYTYVVKGQGMQCRARIIDANQVELQPYEDIGEIKKVLESFPANIQGNFIQFQFEEYSGNESFEWEGFSIDWDLSSNI